MPKALLVTGGRMRTDPRLIDCVKWLSDFDDVLIVGDCPSGTDALAWECLRLVPCLGIKKHADWDRYGAKAGPIRNDQMVDVLKAYRDAGFETAAIAFPGEERSAGTHDCMRRLQAADFDVGVF